MRTQCCFAAAKVVNGSEAPFVFGTGVWNAAGVTVACVDLSAPLPGQPL